MKLWVLIAWILVSPGAAQAASKCWSFERIESFKVRDRWSGQEVRDARTPSAACYATREECDAAVSTKKGSHESNVIYEYYDVAYSACTCDTSAGAAADPLEADFERRVVDEELRDWFLGIINPVSRENLLTLASLFPENAYFAAALEGAGTVLAPVLMAKGYIEMADRVLDASLDRALGVLHVPLERRADFIAASGVFVRGYSQPAGSPFESYYRAKAKPQSVPAQIATYVLDETPWPQIAVATSLRLVAQNDTDVDSYALAAALGLGGYFALREGHEEAGKQLLLGALGALATVDAGSPGEVEELLHVLERANRQYGVAIPATRFSAPSAAAVSPFAGQFRCDTVVDYGSAPPQMRSMADQACATPPGTKVVQGDSWHQTGPFVVEVNGATIRITTEQESYHDSPGRSVGGATIPALRMHYARTCTSSGAIAGTRAHLTGSCATRALMPMQHFREGVDVTYEMDLELAPDGSITAHTSVTSIANGDMGAVRWAPLRGTPAAGGRVYPGRNRGARGRCVQQCRRVRHRLREPGPQPTSAVRTQRHRGPRRPCGPEDAAMKSDAFSKVLLSCANFGAAMGAPQGAEGLRALAGVFAVAPTWTVAKVCDQLRATEGGAEGAGAALVPVVRAVREVIGLAGKADAVTDVDLLLRALETSGYPTVDELLAAMQRATTTKPAAAKRPKAPPVDPDLVGSYHRRLESALGDEPSFRRLLEQIDGDAALGADGVKALSLAFCGGRATSKKDALARIARRHNVLVGARAREASRDGRTAA